MDVQVVLFLALAAGVSYSQNNCLPPTPSQLEEVISDIIKEGDNAAAPTVDLTDYNIVCLAFGEERDRLRIVSVVVEYTCTGHARCPTGSVVEQIEAECNEGAWTDNVAGSTDDVRTQSPLATLTTSDRDDCAFCFSPTKAANSGAGGTSDNVTHCIACNSSCVGLMRCSALGSDDCCNYYNNSLCVDVCPNPFTPNTDNDCVCLLGTTGFNCAQAIDCGTIELGTLQNGLIMNSETTYNSVATYTCNDGYILNGNATRTCLETGLWSGSVPTCTIVDCGSLFDPQNGAVTALQTIFASVATYTCDIGYTLIGNATRICQSDGLWSGSEPTCETTIIGSSCTQISPTDVECVLSSYVDEHGCFDPASCPPVITIVEMYINCLSPGQYRGTYTHTTVTVRYTRSDVNGVYLSQADIGCSNLTGNWEANVLRSIASSIDRVFSFGSGTEDDNTMTSCSACRSPSLAQDLGTVSDSSYHCVGCDNVCLASGLGQCYGPSFTECCSYYSDDLCVDDCGPMREPDTEWQCVCSGGWREPECTVCDLSCDNGGTPDLIECNVCDCLPGFSGSQCSLDIDECIIPGTCLRGNCSNTFGGYDCTCFEGYTGENCDVNIDECQDDRCLNGGVCVDEEPGYSCQCRDGSSGEECQECNLINCLTCNFSVSSDQIHCSLCKDGYTLSNNGICEESCKIDNCLKCFDSDSTKCDECQIDYVATDSGLCIAKDEPTSRPTIGDGGTNNDGGPTLSDFEIAAIITGVIIFILLVMVVLMFIIVHLLKSFCKKETHEEDKHHSVKMAKRTRANPAYIQSFYGGEVGKRKSHLEAQVTLGVEEETEMIDGDGDDEGWEGEVSENEEIEQEDDELGGNDGDTISLSQV